MNELQASVNNNLAIILFFNSHEQLLGNLRSLLTYEGKNQFFQEVILKNSLCFSQECDSYRAFVRITSIDLEQFIMFWCENFGPHSSKSSEFLTQTEETSSPYFKISHYLSFLNSLFCIDESSIDFLNSAKLEGLILDILARFFQYSINPNEPMDPKITEKLKDLSLKLFETLNLLIRRNNYSSIENFIDQSFLERLVFLIDFSMIEEMVLKTIFSITKSCHSNAWFIEFVTKNQILKILPNKIQDKSLDFILMAIEMFYIIPIVKSNEEDLNSILGSLKKKIFSELGNPFMNLKDLLQQIYRYCFREYKNSEWKKSEEKSPSKPSKMPKKKFEELKADPSNKNTFIQNASFVEVLAFILQNLTKNSLSTPLQQDILNFFLLSFNLNSENYQLVAKRFRFADVLINLLLFTSLEIAPLVLRIFYFICTILNINAIAKMYDEFRSISILIKECSNDISFLLIKMLNELVIFDFDVFQPIYIETDIYLSLQMKFLSLLNLDSRKLEREELKKKDQHLNYLIKILRLLLKNNTMLISSFLDIGHFEILLTNIDLHKKLLSPFVLFFLDEEAKNVNLQPYLDFLFKILQKIDRLSDFDHFFNISSILIRSVIDCDSKKVFREAILRRFGFFHKYFDAICLLRTFHPVFDWYPEKQQYLMKSLVLIKKYLVKSKFLKRYFQKKNLFCELIQKIMSLHPYVKSKMEEIVLILLDMAISPFEFLPLNKACGVNKKALKKKEIKLKTWNYFKSESFFVFFPEIFKYLMELLSKKSNLEVQTIFFEIVANVCRVSINLNILNKISLLDTMSIIFFKEIFEGRRPLMDLYLQIFFAICGKNFTVKLAKNLSLIIDHLLPTVLLTNNNFIFLLFILLFKLESQKSHGLCSKIHNMINFLSFSPDFLEFSNHLFSFEQLIFKDSAFKLGKKSSDGNFLTFLIWLNTNASERSKFFNLLDLHSSNDKRLNFLKIYFLNRKLYLKFLDQIETEIILEEFFNKWSHLAFTLTYSKEKAEFSIFQDGLFLQKISFNVKKNMSFGNESLELSMGFDAPLKKKSMGTSEKRKEENVEFFKIGPFLLFDEALSANEINLLYSITDSRKGTINFLTKDHSLSLQRLNTENVKIFDFSLVDFNTNSDLQFSKLLVKLDLSYLLSSLCIELDPTLTTILETKDYEIKKRNLLVVNKAERGENNCGLLCTEIFHSAFLNETLNSMNSFSFSPEFLVDFLLDSLEKSPQNQRHFSMVFQLLTHVCGLFQEQIQHEKICLIYGLILKNKGIFDVTLTDNLFELFSRNIPNKDSTVESNNILITNLRNFSVFFMNSDFYRTLFANSIDITSLFEIFCRKFFNSKVNIFSEINRVALKQLGFLEFLLEMLISNQLIGVEKRIFSLMFEFFLKPTKFHSLDKSKLHSFINFSYSPFLKSPDFTEMTPSIKKFRKIYSEQVFHCHNEGWKLGEYGEKNDLKLSDWGKNERMEKLEKTGEKGENLAFIENLKLLLTPNKKSCEKIPFFDDLQMRKAQRFYDFMIGAKKSELYKQCFISVFCDLFSLNEPEFADILNYKLILQFLLMDSKVEGRLSVMRPTHDLLLKCLFISLQGKEDLKSFVDDPETKIALFPYSSAEVLYFYLSSLLMKNHIKKDEKSSIFEIFNQKITKESLDEQEIQLALLIMEIVCHSFEIVKNFLVFIKKEENFRFLQNFLRRKKHRSQSFDLKGIINNELDELSLTNDPKVLQKRVISKFFESKDQKIKERFLEFYNKIIIKGLLVDEILDFPDFDFLIKFLNKLVRLLLRQKYFKTKFLCLTLVESILRIENCLKEINKLLSGKHCLNEDIQSLIALGIAQIGLFADSSDLANLEKSEAHHKLVKVETQIKKSFSEKEFYEIIQSSIQILEEICDENENNFNEVSKNLGFSFNLLFRFLLRTNNLSYLKWSSGFLINLLKKYFYGEKIESSTKKTGILSGFLNKLGINDQNSKKTNIKQNKHFFNEMHSLLKKTILYIMRVFENKSIVLLNAEESLSEILIFMEDNEGIILDNSPDSPDFTHCIVYLFSSKFFETYPELSSQFVKMLSYLPYHLTKDNLKKIFIYQEQNIYQRIFEKL